MSTKRRNQAQVTTLIAGQKRPAPPPQPQQPKPKQAKPKQAKLPNQSNQQPLQPKQPQQRQHQQPRRQVKSSKNGHKQQQTFSLTPNAENSNAYEKLHGEDYDQESQDDDGHYDEDDQDDHYDQGGHYDQECQHEQDGEDMDGMDSMDEAEIGSSLMEPDVEKPGSARLINLIEKNHKEHMAALKLINESIKDSTEVSKKQLEAQSKYGLSMCTTLTTMGAAQLFGEGYKSALAGEDRAAFKATLAAGQGSQSNSAGAGQDSLSISVGMPGHQPNEQNAYSYINPGELQHSN